MISKQVLLFAAYQEVQDLFESDDRVGYLESDLYNSWTIDGVEIPATPSLEAFIYWEDALRRVKSLTPLFSRYYDDLPRLDLQHRLLAFQIIRLSSALSASGVKFVVFPTGVSHHVLTAQCEIACSLSGIPQIFTYLTNLSPRVVPIIQRKSIFDRKLLGLNVSQVEDEVLPLREDYGAFKVSTERKNESPSDRFFRALGQITWLYLHRRLARSKEFLVNLAFFRPRKIHASYLPLKNYTLSTEIRFLFEQRRILSQLHKLVESSLPKLREEIEKLEKALVIYAHQQPEATTFPEGGDFQNHLDLVVHLRARGYRGPIFYLEHPATNNFTSFGASSRVGISRSKDYFDTLLQLGCLFIDHSAAKEFSQKLQPITISGSIAVERSVLGEVTVVVGEPWYQGLPGTIGIEEFLSGEYSRDKKKISASAIDFLNNAIKGKTITNGLILKNEKRPEGNQSIAFRNEFVALIDKLLEA